MFVDTSSVNGPMPVSPSRRRPILSFVGVAGLSLAAACQDDDAPCSLSICDIEYDERFVDAPQEATARLRDRQVVQLLRALLLEPGALHEDPRPIAFYSLDTEQVIVVTTDAFDDETRVFVLMQVLANAQQAQEIDLRFLLEEQPTRDAAIAAAALVRGEAHFSAHLGM